MNLSGRQEIKQAYLQWGIVYGRDPEYYYYVKKGMIS